MKNLTEQQIEEIAELVAGGCQEDIANERLEDLGIDSYELEDICAKVEVFRCPSCYWWGHQGEILTHENESGESICEDCYEEN